MPQEQQTDYIIIGGGAAGSTIAARLAEIQTNKVLVIEAGPDNTENFFILQAGRYGVLLDFPPKPKVGPYPSPTHWGFVTTPQNGKVYGYPRGTGLGGSTNHHALTDGRGSSLVYDEWAKSTGDPSWKYENLIPYFKKMENYDIPNEFDDTNHGKKGWLHIKHGKLEQGFHPAMIQTANEYLNIPIRYDFSDNPYHVAGIGWTDMQIHNNGERSYAARDLLLPTLKNNKKKGWNNLEIMTDTLVTKILFSGNKAIGVEVMHHPRAYKVDAAHKGIPKDVKKTKIYANKEVILCAGSINTPQILMLSGIGPKDHLKDFGITLIQDLPGVGQHLLDHLEMSLVHAIKNLPNKVWRWQEAMLAETFGKFGLYRKYVNKEALGENFIPLIIDWHSGYDKSDPLYPDIHVHSVLTYVRDFNVNPKKFNDPHPLKKSYMKTFLKQFNPLSPTVFHSFMIEAVKTESGKGSIQLQSTDPTDPPLIDLKLYEVDSDITRIALGVLLLRKLVAHPYMKKYIKEEVLPGAKYDSLEKIKDYIKKYSSFGHHMSGTAKMGNDNDPMAVVDSKMRVKNCKGLRICDASIFPLIPAYNVSRPTYLVAEVLADIIKQDENKE